MAHPETDQDNVTTANAGKATRRTMDVSWFIDSVIFVR